MGIQKTNSRRTRILAVSGLILFVASAAWSQSGEWTVYNTTNSGLPYNGVTALAVDDQGIVWIGTGRWWAHAGGGLARFDGTNWSVYHTGNSKLPHNDVSFLAADWIGNVWAGTYGGGLAKCDGTTCTAYTTANSGLPDNWIWNLSVDPEGNVWAGTKAGLARFDGTRWTVYNQSNSGLPDNNVYYTAFDAEGTIWIGTQDGGLAAFRPQPVVDFNGDGLVDIDDLLRLIESWGQDEPAVDIGPTPFGDGVIDAADLEVLMEHWGQEILSPFLIGHWKLDEAEGIIAFDSVGISDGVAVGDPVWRPAGGELGGALQLDGVDDCVTTAPVCDPSKGPLSVFVRVQGGAPGQVILSQADGANWLAAGVPDGALMTDLKSGGRQSRSLTSTTVITDGAWHRVGLVWDGSTRALYVDDIEVALDTQSNLAGCAADLNIGCGKDMTPGTFWSGLIDDVRIYNRAVKP